MEAVRKNRAAVLSAVSVAVVETTTKQLVEYILHKVRNQNRHWVCLGFWPLLFCTFVLSSSNSVGCVCVFPVNRRKPSSNTNRPSSPTPSNVYWYIHKHTHCTHTHRNGGVCACTDYLLAYSFVFFEAHPTVGLGGVSGRSLTALAASSRDARVHPCVIKNSPLSITWKTS